MFWSRHSIPAQVQMPMAANYVCNPIQGKTKRDECQQYFRNNHAVDSTEQKPFNEQLVTTQNLEAVKWNHQQ